MHPRRIVAAQANTKQVMCEPGLSSGPFSLTWELLSVQANTKQAMFGGLSIP